MVTTVLTLNHLWVDLRKGPTSCKMPKLDSFQPIITWRHQEPSASVFVYRHPALQLKKSNIRKCSYLLTWNSGAPRWGTKWPISTMCDTRNCHTQTRSGWGAKFMVDGFNNWKKTTERFERHQLSECHKFTASVVQWLKNSYTQFQACSYYSLEVMLN